MTSKTKDQIKAFFETGDAPTQAQFIDLIDSYVDASGPIGYLESAASANAQGFAFVSGRKCEVIGGAEALAFVGITVYTTALAQTAVSGYCAVLAGAQTFSGAQRTASTALTSTSSAIAIDLSLNNDFTHTFTQSTTLSNPSNVIAGQKGRVFFTQHASSPKTLTFGTNYKFPVSATDPGRSVSSTNGAIDCLYYDVLNTSVIACNLVKGFS